MISGYKLSEYLDIESFRNSYPQSGLKATSPFLYYLAKSSGRNPITEFDRRYLQNNEDLIHFRGPLLFHYARYKSKERRILGSRKLDSEKFPEIVVKLPTSSTKNISIPVTIFLQIEYGSSLYLADSDSLDLQNQILVETTSIKAEFTKDLTQVIGITTKVQSSNVLIEIKSDQNVFLDIKWLRILLRHYHLGGNDFQILEFENALAFLLTSIRNRLPVSFEILGDKFTFSLKNFSDLPQDKKISQVTFLDHYFKPRIYEASVKKVMILVSHEDSFTGAPLYLRQLANQLRSQGHEVVVLCLRAKYRGGVFSSDGFKTIYVEDLSTEVIIQRDWILSELGKKIVRDFLLLVSPDQMWVNSLNSSCFVELAVKSDIPVCLFVHESFGFSSSNSLSNDYEVMFYDALQNANLVVFGSEYSKTAFNRPGSTLNPLILNSIKTIDPKFSEIKLEVRNLRRRELGISETAHVFLSMATFESRKRLHDIVSAFKLIQLPEACLILVGQVADSEYSDLVVQQTEESKEIFVFPVTQNPSFFYSISNTLIMASEAETYPLVLQEAIHWNLSRLVARFPGYEASCNEENSHLFDVGDIEHLEALMKSCASSPSFDDKRLQCAKMDFLEKSKVYFQHLDRILETLSVVNVSLRVENE